MYGSSSSSSEVLSDRDREYFESRVKVVQSTLNKRLDEDWLRKNQLPRESTYVYGQEERETLLRVAKVQASRVSDTSTEGRLRLEAAAVNSKLDQLKDGDDDEGEEEDEEGRPKKRQRRPLYSPGQGLASLALIEADVTKLAKRIRVAAATQPEYRQSNLTTQDNGFSYSDAPSGGPDDPSGTFSQLIPFFGLPTYGRGRNAGLGHSMENHTLPDAFMGDREYNRSIIFNGLLETAKWYLTEALPLRNKNDLRTIVLDQLIFDNHLLGRLPYHGTPNLVTNRRATSRFGIVRYGLGQELEGSFYRTKEGQRIWAGGHEQFRTAAEETFCLGVAVEMLSCKMHSSNDADIHNQQRSREAYEREIREECENYDSIRKGTSGLQTTFEIGKGKLKNNGILATEDTLFIVPEGAIRHNSLDPAANTHSFTGQTKTHYDPITGNKTMPGIGRVRESRGFKLGPKSGFYDPMFRPRSMGSWFFAEGTSVYAESNSPDAMDKYETDQCSIGVYRHSLDDEYKHRYDRLHQSNFLYDAAGKITAAGIFTLSKCDYWDRKGEDTTSQAIAKRKTTQKALWGRAQRLVNMSDPDYKADEYSTTDVKAYYDKIGRSSDVAALISRRLFGSPSSHAVSAIAEASQYFGADVAAAFSTQNIANILTHMATISLRKRDWFTWCLKYNIPVYMPYLVVVNQIVWLCGSAIVLLPGAGHTYVGFSRYNIGFNAKSDGYIATFTVHGRPKVTDERRIARITNCFSKEYVYGDNGILHTQADAIHLAQNGGRLQDDVNASMCKTAFAIALPPGFKMSGSFFDISGQYNSRDCTQSGPDHYPVAEAMRQTLGFRASPNHNRENVYQFTQGMRQMAPPNTVCCQGFQTAWRPNNGALGGTWSLVTRDHGHKGRDWAPGSMQNLKRYRLEAPAIFSSGAYTVVG